MNDGLRGSILWLIDWLIEAEMAREPPGTNPFTPKRLANPNLPHSVPSFAVSVAASYDERASFVDLENPLFHDKVLLPPSKDDLPAFGRSFKWKVATAPCSVPCGKTTRPVLMAHRQPLPEAHVRDCAGCMKQLMEIIGIGNFVLFL